VQFKQFASHPKIPIVALKKRAGFDCSTRRRRVGGSRAIRSSERRKPPAASDFRSARQSVSGTRPGALAIISGDGLGLLHTQSPSPAGRKISEFGPTNRISRVGGTNG
jgi:hypothetical protein